MVQKVDVHRLKDRNVVMRWVANPGLPEVSSPANTRTGDVTEQWSAEQIAAYSEGRGFIRLSAAVVENVGTYVRWWHDGNEYHAWSNADFRYLQGVGRFERAGVVYDLTMGVGVTTLEAGRTQGWMNGPPVFPTNEPSYVVVRGEEPPAGALELMEALHDLYAGEKDRLVLAYEGRQRSEAERQARLKLNPPQPKDAVISFWPREGSRYYQETGPAKEEAE